MSIARRKLLWTAASGALASLGVAAGLLAPRGIQAALPPETFLAKSSGGAINALLGTSEAPIDDRVELTVPAMVEVADYVPVSVDTALEGVESITIVADENPNPIIASFQLDPRLVPYVATRVRLATAGNLHALVKAGGSVHRASKNIAVTIGGCGDPEEGPERRAEAQIPLKNVLLRARKGDDGLVVRTLITHPMTPPTMGHPQKDELAGHFIQEVAVQLNGRTVLRGDWSAGVSQNPYLSFKIRETRTGDLIRVGWTDNHGMTGSSEVKID